MLQQYLEGKEEALMVLYMNESKKDIFKHKHQSPPSS